LKCAGKPRRPAGGNGLRLVVGRQHVGLVLGPELGGLKHRLPGSVGHERQLTARSLVGHDLETAYVAAELDIRLLCYVS
jgi:hypothetical protein